MTRITAPFINQTEVLSWEKTKLDQIERHPAWKKSIDKTQVESLLEGKKTLSYLLRAGEKERVYYISFVQKDGSIKHQQFTLENDRKGWYYKNGANEQDPADIVSENLEELIPKMMHCDYKECKRIK